MLVFSFIVSNRPAACADRRVVAQVLFFLRDAGAESMDTNGFADTVRNVEVPLARGEQVAPQP